MRRILKILSLFIFILVPLFAANGQDSLFVLRPSDVSEFGYLRPAKISEWEFKMGHDPSWKNSSITDTSWTKLDSTEIANLAFDDDGKFEGWFRFRFKMEGEFKVPPFFIVSNNTAAQEIYLDGEFIGSFGAIGEDSSDYRMRSPEQFIFLPIKIGESHQIAIHFLDREVFNINPFFEPRIIGNNSFLFFTDFKTAKERLINYANGKYPFIIGLIITTLIFLVILFISILNRSELHLRYSIYFIFLIFCFILTSFIVSYSTSIYLQGIVNVLSPISLLGMLLVLPVLCSQIFYNRIPKWVKIISLCTVLIFPMGLYNSNLTILPILISVLSCIYIVFKSRKSISIPKWAIVLGVIGTPLCIILVRLLPFLVVLDNRWVGYYILFSLSLFPISILAYIVLWLRESVTNEKEKTAQVIALTEEKQQFLKDQNINLERQVSKRTKELNESLENLKATQSQLIQSEKMASLGELTAGIAHEIQNPLNFVNNFSEVSSELIDELKAEMKSGDLREVDLILEDIKENLNKINHHGNRAGNIVKGMLQHSRESSGKKEKVDVNQLVDEYLRLAYHGFKAKDKSFNCELNTQFDESLPKINLVPQDIGRVVLNIITNAFQTVTEKSNSLAEYSPLVTVSTTKVKNNVLISISDNGKGMTEEVKNKIFQPFFTTKPTGQGTGLGMSLSYDIIKAHNGTIEIDSTEGEGTQFCVILPLSH